MELSPFGLVRSAQSTVTEAAMQSSDAEAAMQSKDAEQRCRAAIVKGLFYESETSPDHVLSVVHCRSNTLLKIPREVLVRVAK
jgi:hypothetical protein